MRRTIGRAIAFLLILAAATACWPAGPALAQGSAPGGGLKPPFEQVGIDQRIGQTVPPDLRFADEEGKAVRLADLYQGKPVLLSLAYFRCPMLCPLVQNGMASSMRVLGLRPGKDFTAVTVSIDPHETPEQAAAAKKRLIEREGIPGAAEGWRFLTGDEASVRDLASAVGFRYAYDAGTDQFAHAAGVMVITPQGRIAQYFLGIDYAPKDLRLALVEASEGRIGTIVDRLTLLCYEYDPATGHYGLVIYSIVRAGGVLTVLALAVFVIVMLRRDARLAARRVT